jgi:heavy metal efflux system protein
MIGKLVQFSVRARFIVLLFVLGLIAHGIRGYILLPIDAVPDVTNVQVQVLTSAPGLSPTEMEMMVTQPVEVAMTGIPGLSEMRSISRAGISAVTVVFEDGTDLHHARMLVSQRLPAAQEDIPASAGSPQLGPLTTGLGEVYHFIVRWPGHTTQDVRTLLEWDIGYRLRSVPGVVEVNAWGGDTRQIDVLVDSDSLRSFGLTAEDVEAAIQSGGENVGGGAIERGAEQVYLRVVGIYDTVESVSNQVVTTLEDGRPVLVRDVAKVREGAAMRLSGATADGQGEVVYAMVQMIAGGNAHQVVARVKERLEEIRPALPEGVEIEPIYDRAELVDEVLHTVRWNLIEGGVVVALVLLIMLGDLAAGLLVASAIPLAMLGAFALMQATGMTGNLMSLGAIDFGLVVDGAVVMVEGALAIMATRKVPARPAMACVGMEVGRPVAFGVLIISIVYVPILLLEGVEGRTFRPMAWTVLFALGTALVLTFTWIPAIGSFLLRKIHHRDPWIVRQMTRVYQPVLAFVLKRPWFAVAGAVLITLAGTGVASTMGAEFVPRLEEGDVVVQLNRPPSVSLTESAHGTTELEKALLKFPEVEHVVSRVGAPDVATDVMGIEMADVFVILKPRKQWTTAHDAAGFADAMSASAEAALPGTDIAFTQPIEMRMQELIGGVKAAFGVKVFGDDMDTLSKIANDVARTVSKVPGAADVRVEATQGLMVLTVKPDSRKMARLGVRTGDVASFVQMLRGGRGVGQLVEGQKRFDIVMRYGKTPVTDPDVVGKLLIPLPGGRSVPLGDVAEITLGEGPAQVSREQAHRRVMVEANVRGRDLATFVQEARGRVQAMKVPPGYYFAFGGEFENLERASKRLAIVVPGTLAVILVLLFLAFGSARPAVLIFLNVPAAASGGIIALALRGLPFSMSAAVGFIALFGVATLNGVVLVAAIRQLEQEGQSTPDAVQHAATTRLRPVMTTALVASLGFLPMAIASGTGAEVQIPLATVVIGGLVTATMATLLALPSLYRRWGRSKSELAELAAMGPSEDLLGKQCERFAEEFQAPKKRT